MSLKRLIKNQTIKIDDHKAGAREIKQWDKSDIDVHIHKSTNFRVNGKKQNIDIKIPINSERPLSVMSMGKDIDIPKDLKKEILEAFRNPTIRNNFVDDVIKNISEYKTELSSIDRAESVLRRISRHFGLDDSYRVVKKYDGDNLVSLTLVYDKLGHDNVFCANINCESITVGQNNGYAKQFDVFDIK